MKISVEIPADITSLEDKWFVGLTKRQIVCFLAAILLGVPTFYLLKTQASEDVAQYALLIIATLCFAFLKKKNGLPLEVYLKFMIRRHLTPSVRPYHIENIYDYLVKEDTLYEQLQAKAKKASKRVGAKGKARSKKPKKRAENGTANAAV